MDMAYNISVVLKNDLSMTHFITYCCIE